MWDFTKHTQYTFRSFRIPVRMMDGLERYIEHHVPPGDFLSAVLKNDLRSAVDRADDENLNNLPAYIGFLYNQAPAQCWGSPRACNAWVNNNVKE